MLKAKTRIFIACLLITQFEVANAQESQQTSNTPKPVVFDTQQDRQHMLDQLGITKLRPGKSGDADDPNAANTDESKANPYPKLPEIMTMKDGTQVTTSEQWWKQRRPEIIDDFEREVLGRIPNGVPNVEWKLLKSVDKKLGEIDVVEKRLAATVDKSDCPEIVAYIFMSLTVPKDAKKPVPTLMQFGFTWFGLDGEEFEFEGRRGFGSGGGPSKEQLLVEAGWGCATVAASHAKSLDPDEDPMAFQSVESKRTQARKLLHSLQEVPGEADDDIDQSALSQWIHELRTVVIEDDELEQIGMTLGNWLGRRCLADEAGRIIESESFSQALEELCCDATMDGFEEAVSHSRGVTSRSPFEGGNQERELEDYFNGLSVKHSTTFPLVAKCFRQLANHCRSYAEHEDEEAAQTRLHRR